MFQLLRKLLRLAAGHEGLIARALLELCELHSRAVELDAVARRLLVEVAVRLLEGLKAAGRAAKRASEGGEW